MKKISKAIHSLPCFPQGRGALFVSATDTNAGKTYVTRLLFRELQALHGEAKVFKPVCCGGREDIEQLLDVAKNQSEEETNGFYYHAAATPCVAAALEGRNLDADEVLEWCGKRASENRLLPQLWEGAGGWMVPIAFHHPMSVAAQDDKGEIAARGFTSGPWCVADWVQQLEFPVLLVVAERLGCLNHTLLTVRDMDRRGVELAGIILNCIPGGVPAAGDHREILEKEFGLPVWGRIGEGSIELPREIKHQLHCFFSSQRSDF